MPSMSRRQYALCETTHFHQKHSKVNLTAGNGETGKSDVSTITSSSRLARSGSRDRQRPRYRSRSRSPPRRSHRDRRSRSPERRRSRSRCRFRVRKQSGWDVPPVESASIASHPVVALQALTAQHALTKPARDIYIGNLNPSQSKSSVIKQFFADIFNLLPEYQARLAALCPYGPIRDVKLTGEAASFCFVEFWTEELASTALLLDKVDFYGRLLKIGRPTGQGYDLSHLTIPPPMDVAVLRTQGILSVEAPVGQEIRRARQVYVGNLPGKITAQLLRELFEPACRNLPEFNAVGNSNAVVNVELHNDGRFAFVELQSEALATAALGIFNNTEILGRRILVGRAQPGLTSAQQHVRGALANNSGHSGSQKILH